MLRLFRPVSLSICPFNGEGTPYGVFSDIVELFPYCTVLWKAHMQPPLIMVIDDSATVRKLVEVSLKREGYRVVSFVDGVAALRWLVQPNAQAPDIIFLDILLPKMDGFQIARYLKQRQQYSRIPIVMLTRSSSVVDLFKAKLCGVRNYMTKPFTMEDLAQMAKTLTGAIEAVEL